MILSEKDILRLSGEMGFNPLMLEKVLYLMQLLQSLNKHPFLKGKWVLKGGTALNLFIFNLPRLSVDIDLNYIGSVDREQMKADRPKIEQACAAVFSREGFTVKRAPTDHAGGKWILSYISYSGQPGNLEVDFNFMFRQPLWEPMKKESIKIGRYVAEDIPVLDQHELVAGKLAALLARTQSRDLYDSARIFDTLTMDNEFLRIAFIVYGGMNRVDWRTVSIESVAVDPDDLGRKLFPVLHNQRIQQNLSPEAYGATLVEKCREGLQRVIPFTPNERSFLDMLLNEGVIDPGLLTSDPELQKRIQVQPLLQWKALNVRKYRGLE
ncbi:MAG: nucleotidyl transferase AbiEii/AbiGii toxin family protein [Spirochaetales bacterium]|nr:nucleotidyl transferase AbiEii/AbiGii toxin family protein [Spirochaetales bacterium]